MAIKHKSSIALPKSLTGVQTISYNPEVDSLLRGANLVALQGSLSRHDLWYEAALLKRLLYKSKNQHRSSKHFQYLSEVNRCLKLLQQMQLSDLLGDLHRLSMSGATPMPSSASIVMFGSANKVHMPSQQAGILVLQRLLAGCRLATQTLPAVHAAAAQLLAQLSMTYFMPFCLTALSMVARVQVLVCQLLMDGMKAYNCLLPLVTALPRQGPPFPTSAHPDLPQMISCTWAGGLPTLSLIPHTDPPTFAAAAQAFATVHYPQHQAVSTPTSHSQHTSRDVPTTSKDAGQPIRRVSTTASKVKALAADDFGEKITRGTAVPEEDCGQQMSRALGSPFARSIEAAQISRDQRPTSFQAGSAGRRTTLDAAEMLGSGHPSSIANPAASPSLSDKPGMLKAAAELHRSTDFFQLPTQRQDLTKAPDQSATSLTKPVSQLAAATEAKGGKRLLASAAGGYLERNGASLDGGPLHPGLRAIFPQTHLQKPSDPPRAMAGTPQAQAKPSPGLRDASAAAASGLLVFEDRQVVSADGEEECRVQYRHTLPSAVLGSQASRQPAPFASLAQPPGPPTGPPLGDRRGQHQAERHVQSRKRPREDGLRPLAAHPPALAKSSSHWGLSSNTTDLPKRQPAQPGIRSAPGSGSSLSVDARSSGRAFSRAPARTGSDEHGPALPTGSNAQGRASSRAPLPAKQHSMQPAFICIDEDKDKPRTLHRRGQSPPVLSHPGSNRPGLSTAAQTDPLIKMPVHSRMSQQAAAVAASATPPAASSAALLTTQTATNCFSHGICAVFTTQAADVTGDCTDALQQSSHAYQHDTAAAAATAAAGAPTCMTMPNAAAQQLEGASPTISQSAAVGSAASESVVVGSAALGSAAIETLAAPGSAASESVVVGSAALGSAATETLAAPGSAVTPPPPLLNSSANAAASAPRAMLPTSRRKKKGPKAAKPQEVVKAGHSWQALLGSYDAAKPEVPATTSPPGCEEQAAKRCTDHQQTSEADKAPSSASTTQDIMNLLLGKQ